MKQIPTITKALLVIALALIILSIEVKACGCGIAIAKPEVFNSLKESNVYLITNIYDDGSFSISPYFRFVSLGDPHNVTMVFPLKAVPQSVNAETLSLSDFLSSSGVSTFQYDQYKQSITGLAENMKPYGEVGLSLYGIGFGGSALLLASLAFTTLGVFSGASALGSAGAVASFTFEGGTLNIYNANASGTLRQVAESKGIQYEGKLAELINRYSDYYVAILELKVPSVLPPSQLQAMRTVCQDTYNLTKELLKNNTNITYRDIDPTMDYPSYTMVYYIRQDIEKGINDSSSLQSDPLYCKSLAWLMINNAVGGSGPINYYDLESSQTKGIFLTMNFKAGDTIFYPVSVVNSYEYPVSHQYYFVETPLNKDLDFISSGVSSTTLSQGKRWYQITDTQQDLEVKPIDAGIMRSIQDQALLTMVWLNQNVFWIFVAIYVAIIALMYYFIRKRGVKKASITGLVLFGAFYFAYKIWDKDRKLAYITVLVIGIFAFMALV